MVLVTRKREKVKFFRFRWTVSVAAIGADQSVTKYNLKRKITVLGRGKFIRNFYKFRDVRASWEDVAATCDLVIKLVESFDVSDTIETESHVPMPEQFFHYRVVYFFIM